MEERFARAFDGKSFVVECASVGRGVAGSKGEGGEIVAEIG